MADDLGMLNTFARRLVTAVLSMTFLVLALTVAPSLGGVALAGADTGSLHQVSDGCGSGYYENSRGRCVPVPDGNTTGIRCEDGTYSHAETRNGACSRHGGIAEGEGNGADAAVALGALGVGSAVVGGALLLPALLSVLAFGS